MQRSEDRDISYIRRIERRPDLLIHIHPALDRSEKPVCSVVHTLTDKPENCAVTMSFMIKESFSSHLHFSPLALLPRQNLKTVKMTALVVLVLN